MYSADLRYNDRGNREKVLILPFLSSCEYTGYWKEDVGEDWLMESSFDENFLMYS